VTYGCDGWFIIRDGDSVQVAVAMVFLGACAVARHYSAPESLALKAVGAGGDQSRDGLSLDTIPSV